MLPLPSPSRPRLSSPTTAHAARRSGPLLGDFSEVRCFPSAPVWMRFRGWYFLPVLAMLLLSFRVQFRARVVLIMHRVEADFVNCSRPYFGKGPPAFVDPIVYQLDKRTVWPGDFALHREIAAVINRLPCRRSPLHQLPPDVLRVRLLFVSNCYDLKQLALMLIQLRAVAQMCEFGWHLSVVILTAVCMKGKAEGGKVVRCGKTVLFRFRLLADARWPTDTRYVRS